MDEQYLSGLAALKGTFLSGNEAQVLAECIIEQHPSGCLTLLDVGTGTGRGLVELVACLRKQGLTVDATAIDIFVSSDAADRMKADDIVPQQIDFGDYAPGVKFDVILATQSLYYFADLQGTLGHICELLNDKGLLCVTLWNDQCILRKIASKVFGAEASMSLGPSVILEYLEKDQRFRRLSSRGVVETVVTCPPSLVHG